MVLQKLFRIKFTAYLGISVKKDSGRDVFNNIKPLTVLRNRAVLRIYNGKLLGLQIEEIILRHHMNREIIDGYRLAKVDLG